MKTIKVFDVVFHNEIEEYEIEAFRGAISKLVGFENTLYHNHLSDSKVAYSYPLIQYKTKYKKASLSFLGQGVEEARAFFINKSWTIYISGRDIKLEIDTFNLRNETFSISENIFDYDIVKWMPLNQENFKRFIQLKTTEERVKMLEGILIGNLLSMAKSFDWRIDKQIQLSINEITDEHKVTFKKNSIITYDLKFSSNILVPVNIGLGKGVSHGFGIINKRIELTK